ncbi:MAG: M15 family metallopeptidase [Candidatus Aminicenantes bacterium]|nr:MAG: M15 family metallopeptidase [Candidatus Aminicenantes bacterium]
MNYPKSILTVILFLFCIVGLIAVYKTMYGGASSSVSSEIKPLSFQPNHPGRESEIQTDKKYLLGKFEPSQEKGFVEVDSKYTNNRRLYLRQETYEAFIRMHDAALQSGIKLIIISAARNFNSQKYIWEGKWNGRTAVDGKNLAETVSDPVERARIILRFSSMPGTSRHHWGTDIDLNALDNKYFSTGEGKKIYNWLMENASDYGFCQTYTPRNSTRPTGYEEEKWHWSYLPLARSFLDQYTQKVSYDDLKGFLGWETAKILKVIEDYVRSINKNCK